MLKANVLINLAGTFALVYSGYGFLIPWFYLQAAFEESAEAIEKDNRFSWSR